MSREKAEVQVATSGRTISRHDRCGACSRPVKYKVDTDERVLFSFCSEPLCERFLTPAWEKERTR